jgi:hypothetical protein
VTENDVLNSAAGSIRVLDRELVVVTALHEAAAKLGVLLDRFVMVPVDQEDLTVQARQKTFSLVSVTEQHVTEVVDGVTGLNSSVPASDHLLVHLVGSLFKSNFIGSLEDGRYCTCLASFLVVSLESN